MPGLRNEDRLRGVLDKGVPGVGDAAPDFELPALIAGVRQPLRLSAYRGQKSVVLAFYPFNWQDVSAAQLVSYQVQRPRVLASNAEIVAITVDSTMNTTAWERAIGPFEFPMCSDFWPHGEISERYGLLRKSGEAAGASERAVLIVDRSGSVVFRRTYAPDEVAPVEEVLTVLEKI
ncbi:MAG TPA: redoxin domain-containing protein [Terriglobales bacterium]|jgi:alkyl hydroperoxide reductase subunit AhpC|nr:redoxin domain-containing protein [Terriglobales bacterium]